MTDNLAKSHVFSELRQMAVSLLACMETRNFAPISDLFASESVVLLDSFFPYVFDGSNASVRWAERFIEHAKELKELRHDIGEPQEFSTNEDIAFVSLPVAWQGEVHGKSFYETGGLALIFVCINGKWKIQNYAWAVTGFTLKDENR